MTGSRRARLVSSAASVAVFVAAVAGCTSAGKDRSDVAATPAAAPASASAGSPKPAVSGSAQPRAGWKTIEHRDVRVDIPADWVHPDTGGCEVEYEKWAPAGSPRCTMTTGVVFYGAATFDPAHGPGVRQNRNGDWAGYVFAGDLAVYAIGPDRDLVEDLLGTARPPAPR